MCEATLILSSLWAAQEEHNVILVPKVVVRDLADVDSTFYTCAGIVAGIKR